MVESIYIYIVHNSPLAESVVALRKNQSPLRNTSSVAPAVLPAWGVKSLLTCREPQGPAMEEVPWMEPPLLAPQTEAPTKKWSWIYLEYDFPVLGHLQFSGFQGGFQCET